MNTTCGNNTNCGYNPARYYPQANYPITKTGYYPFQYGYYYYNDEASYPYFPPMTRYYEYLDAVRKTYDIYDNKCFTPTNNPSSYIKGTWNCNIKKN